MAAWPTYPHKRSAFVRCGYTPTDLQAQAHRSDARFLAIFGGERAGKSRVAAMEALACIPWCDRIALVGQSYTRCRPEFQYILDGSRVLNNVAEVKTPEAGAWSMTTKTGCTISTVSVEEGPGALTGTGLAFNLVLLCEAGLMRYDCFLAARGRVAETVGRIIAVGTLWNDYGWWADMWRALAGANVFGGERFALPTWENRAIFPGGQQDPEILALKATLPASEYARRIDALIMPSPAKIYQEFNHAVHVKATPYVPGQPVTPTIDAGYFPSAYAVLAIQLTQNARGQKVVQVIDEIYEHQQVHALIIELAKSRPWWGDVKRLIGGHEVRQHQAAESTEEIWRRLTGYHMTPAPADIMAGVLRLKTFLVDPATEDALIQIDPRCQNLIREFGLYRRRTDSRGEVVSEEPEDKDNDCLDALRNYVVAEFGWVEVKRKPQPVARDVFAYLR